MVNVKQRKICKICDQKPGPQTEQCSSATCDGSAAPACLKQLQISDSRLGANVSVALLTDYAILPLS